MTVRELIIELLKCDLGSHVVMADGLLLRRICEDNGKVYLEDWEDEKS